MCFSLALPRPPTWRIHCIDWRWTVEKKYVFGSFLQRKETETLKNNTYKIKYAMVRTPRRPLRVVNRVFGFATFASLQTAQLVSTSYQPPSILLHYLNHFRSIGRNCVAAAGTAAAKARTCCPASILLLQSLRNDNEHVCLPTINSDAPSSCRQNICS